MQHENLVCRLRMMSDPRALEGKKLPPELLPILRSQVYRGNTDELSLSAISEKWSRWFQERPSISAEDMKLAREGLDIYERKRLRAIKKL